jgi:nicotinate-nucleotide pyrophosphorylase (carboxylating)
MIISPPYLSPSLITRQVQTALTEDLGHGDLTAQLLPSSEQGRAQVWSRETGLFCGQAWFEACFKQLDPQSICHFMVKDGEKFSANQLLVEITGSLQALVSAERSALNFIQLLSGTASLTAQYVEKISDTSAKLYDTRKTIPGLRLAQKYAVLCGGGHNHRLGLWDALLLKENHLRAFASPRAAVLTAKARFPNAWVEIEVETLTQLQDALSAQPDRVLLDNFTVPLLKEAVALTQGACPLEASGNVSLDTIHTIAMTGVDVISCGALTKNVRAIDFSLLLC